MSRVKNFKEWHTEPDLWVKLKPIAREMRHQPTEAENMLWQQLRNSQILGFKVRRQHNIERFIVDFCCPEAMLVIEIDGPIHQYQKDEDAVRQEYLEKQGYKVIRFSNEEALSKSEWVIGKIEESMNLSV